ncbi:hypothetical protein T440DRAFT_389716 [Plenodomus tracheiphilus IPT5]|uniref:Uncharacterized protein n=1 Tax=Plenodomus tracheiphilus IPT5 TaxID=1408161 RepID=A0A6A7BED5_9PLEO|nr:hypothetical protein T440DRAFT_389716 [Plenodomus tracheiphilus IPT5]
MSSATNDSTRPYVLLLALPRDIRDIITKHTLRQNNGLQVQVSPNATGSPTMHIFAKSIEDSNSTTPNNPLSLVCKQFHTETRNMIFASNPFVEIVCMGSAMPNNHGYTAFLRHISTAARQQLRRVTVTGNTTLSRPPMMFTRLSSLASTYQTLCTANPHIVVTLRIPAMRQVNITTWFDAAISLHRTLRGDSPLSRLLEASAVPLTQAWRILFERIFGVEDDVVLGNLRFEFTVERFPGKEIAVELEGYRRMGLVKSPVEMFELKRAVRRLFDEGI